MKTNAILLVSTLLIAINIAFFTFGGSKAKDSIPKTDTIQISGENLLERGSVDTTTLADTIISMDTTYTLLETGKASWYGSNGVKGIARTDGYHGKRTASGEIFDTHDLTAAHKKLKFGTLVRVTNLDNDKTVIVRINDRGPFIKGRVIDLSYAGKSAIDMGGVAKVKLELVEIKKSK